MIQKDDLTGQIILFDGVCNLCSGAVQFIIKKDPKAIFHFASLQSEFAQNILAQFKTAPEKLSSIVLVSNGKLFTKSAAALTIAKKLQGIVSLLYALMIVPPVIRDAIYDFIARHRYKWFGKKNACWLPTPNLKSRFLD